MRRRALFATLIALAPRAALACPVCFGQNDSPMALGINYGILVMIGFIGSVLAGFAGFFIYLMRRAHLAEQPALPGATAPDTLRLADGGGPVPRARSLGHVPQAQEGSI
jgi:hypothetical protein